MATSTILIKIEALNQATKNIAPVTKELNNLNQASQVAGTKLDEASKKARVAGSAFENLGLKMQTAGGKMSVLGQRLSYSVSLPLLMFGKNAIDTSLSVEEAFVRFEKVFSGTEEDLNFLKGAAGDLAVKFGQPIEEILKSMGEFNKAGVSSREELVKLGEVTAQTAILFDTDLETAFTGVKSVMMGFNLTAAETEVALAKINYIADKTTASEEGILEVMNRSAGVARAYGFSLESLASAQGVFEKNAISSGRAGNALKSIIISLGKQSEAAKEHFGDLGVAVGDKKQQLEFLAASMDKTTEELESMGITTANASQHFKDLGLNLDGAMGKFATLNIDLGSFIGSGKESARAIGTNSAKTKELNDKLEIANARLKEAKKNHGKHSSAVLSAANNVENLKEKIAGANVSTQKLGKTNESVFRTASVEDKLKALSLAYAQVQKNANPKEVADFNEAIADMFGKYQANNAIALLEDMALEFDNNAETISQYYLGVRLAADETAALKWQMEQIDLVLKSSPQNVKSLNEKYRLQTAILGNELLPIKIKLLTAITGLIEKFNSLDPSMQSAIIKFGAVLVVVGPLLALVGNLVTGIGAFGSALTFLGGILPTTTASIATMNGTMAASTTSATILANFMKGGLIVAFAAVTAYIVTKAVIAWNDLNDQLEKNAEQLAANAKLYDEMQKKVGSLSTESANEQMQNAIDAGKELDKTMQGVNDRYDGFAGKLRMIGDRYAEVWEGIKKLAKQKADGDISFSDLFKKAIKLNTGGVVGNQKVVYAANGFSPKGRDTIPAMLSPGEMVLNQTQQSNLFDMLSGRIAPQNSSAGINVEIKVGTMIASRGEQREFARKIQELLQENLAFN